MSIFAPAQYAEAAHFRQGLAVKALLDVRLKYELENGCSPLRLRLHLTTYEPLKHMVEQCACREPMTTAPMVFGMYVLIDNNVPIGEFHLTDEEPLTSPEAVLAYFRATDGH